MKNLNILKIASVLIICFIYFFFDSCLHTKYHSVTEVEPVTERMLPASGGGGTGGDTYNPAGSHEASAPHAPPPGVYTLPSSGETETLSPPPSYHQATTST